MEESCIQYTVGSRCKKGARKLKRTLRSVRKCVRNILEVVGNSKGSGRKLLEVERNL